MIHPQAIIEEGAIIGDNVTVGPWSFIGKNVVIGDNCVINSHVVIKGPSRIGKNNRFFQFCSIGEECQDLKYDDEPTELVIGDSNIFREGCTIHRGTIQDNSLTQIGSHNLFMAYAHVAHDCIVGDHCILANNASLAGHVHVGDRVIFGAMSGVHQFCHIGSHSFVAGGSIVLKDIPAYITASGHPAAPFGLNSEGLKRRGFDKPALLNLKRAYKAVYRKKLSVEDALLELAELAKESPEVTVLADSIKNSTRGIIR
jgi:UDP-N-acetylglucosamine acyltransferase